MKLLLLLHNTVVVNYNCGAGAQSIFWMAGGGA